MPTCPNCGVSYIYGESHECETRPRPGAAATVVLATIGLLVGSCGGFWTIMWAVSSGFWADSFVALPLGSLVAGLGLVAWVLHRRFGR